MSSSLEKVLNEAQRLGFLGRGPVSVHRSHAHGFLVGLDTMGSLEVVVDLGSGGGVPALVVALERPEVHVVLVERMQKRADWLRRAVSMLGLGQRATVVATDVQTYAAAHRGEADAVTARSFGAPPIVAECAAPLLRLDGILIVSDALSADEPPRWPADHLAMVGLSPDATWSVGSWPFVRLRASSACPTRFPRSQRAMERQRLF